MGWNVDAGTPPAPPPTPTPPTPTTPTRISLDYHPDVCMDLKDGDARNGGIIQLFKCSGTVEERQLWSLSPQDQIIHYAANDAMCVDTGSVREHAYLSLWECSGSDQQMFGYDPEMKAIYLTKSGDASLCLQAEGGSTADGAHLIVSQCSGLWSQMWLLNGDNTLVV